MTIYALAQYANLWAILHFTAGL